MRRQKELLVGAGLIALAIAAGGWWKRASPDGSPGPRIQSGEEHRVTFRRRSVSSMTPAAVAPPGRKELVPEADHESVFKGTGIMPPPQYYPRDPAEWQGRLVEVSVREQCNDFGSCGRARACRADDTCGPCVRDGDCIAHEVCVLNNCVLEEKVRCRSQSDCPGESLCMLDDDGSASGWRGNEALYAVCSGSEEERSIAASTDDSDESDQARGPKPKVPPEAISIENLAEELSVFIDTPVQLEKSIDEPQPD